MKRASKIMYTVGRIFSIFEIVTWALMVILGIVFILASNGIAENDPQLSAEGVLATGIAFVIAFGIMFLITLVVLILAARAKKSLDNNTTENGPHIMMIVIGVFGVPFYILGGIFGLVAEHQG